MNSTLEGILNVVDLLCYVALTLIVLAQSGKGEGLSAALGGSAETFFGKNKGRSLDAKLQKLTVVFAVVFFLLTGVLALFS
jgi:preprotein translocase subunit SecG